MIEKGDDKTIWLKNLKKGLSQTVKNAMGTFRTDFDSTIRYLRNQYPSATVNSSSQYAKFEARKQQEHETANQFMEALWNMKSTLKHVSNINALLNSQMRIQIL